MRTRRLSSTSGAAALGLLLTGAGTACSSEQPEGDTGQPVHADAGSGGRPGNGGAGWGGAGAPGGSSGAGGARDSGLEASIACTPQGVADAGPVPLIACSNDPLRVGHFSPDSGWCEPSERSFCPAAWGCDSFEATLQRSFPCDFMGSARVYSGRQSGFPVIGGPYGPGWALAYYDPDTLELMGYYAMDDVGMVDCSGRVPKAIWGTYSPRVTDEEPHLCGDGGAGDAGDAAVPSDGGAADGATDARSADAADD